MTDKSGKGLAVFMEFVLLCARMIGERAREERRAENARFSREMDDGGAGEWRGVETKANVRTCSITYRRPTGDLQATYGVDLPTN